MPSIRRAIAGGAYHWREYGLAELLPDPGDGMDVLLVGCGDGGERAFLHKRGFWTVAFDIRRSDAVDFQGDAHFLPVRDGSFDVVISMQVLEHLIHPWQAVQEMQRVLRPGGWCLGSVAFLKPFHGSYFHMSHWGVHQLLSDAGLAVDRLYGAQSVTYSILGGILPLGSRPLRRAILGFFDRSLLRLRSLAWSVSRKRSPKVPLDRFGSPIPMSFEQFDGLRFAPAVVFRARNLRNLQ